MAVLQHHDAVSGTARQNVVNADVEGQAQEMSEQLAKQMAEKQGVTEALKAGDMMAWVRKMNNIRNAAEEAIYNEIIYA